MRVVLTGCKAGLVVLPICFANSVKDGDGRRVVGRYKSRQALDSISERKIGGLVDSSGVKNEVFGSGTNDSPDGTVIQRRSREKISYAIVAAVERRGLVVMEETHANVFLLAWKCFEGFFHNW